jgi:hypothetical protein
MLVLVLTGCFTWEPYAPGTGLVSSQSLPPRVRAIRQDSTRFALTAPFVQSDSLFGRVQGDTVAVPVADIISLDRERFSIGRTLGVVLGVPIAAFGLTYLVVCGIGGCQAIE